VTEADEAAERIILSASPASMRGAGDFRRGCLAGSIPERGGFPRRPLDGTKEFISKNGEFTVNIALVEAAYRWQASSTRRP